MASAVGMIAGFGLISSTPAGAITTYAVGNDHVTCMTLGGTIKFATHLKNSGATTGNNTITVVATFGGCVDNDKGAVKMFTGTSNVVLHTSNGTNCNGLLGPSNVAASADIVWKPAAGQAFSPKITVGTVQKMATHIAFQAVQGGVYGVTGQPAGGWASVYGLFQIGAVYGVPLTASGEFTGGNGGATGWFAGTTQQDAFNINNMCASIGGVATLNFGIGSIGHT